MLSPLRGRDRYGLIGALSLMWMGTGDHQVGGHTIVWAHTTEIAVGDFVQLTFTVASGRICGFVNGVRSGAIDLLPSLPQKLMLSPLI